MIFKHLPDLVSKITSSQIFKLLPTVTPKLLSGLFINGLPRLASSDRIRVNMLTKWLLESDSCAVIAFTSRLPREGVSTVVAGLAQAFGVANTGNMLVIEITPGRRRIADLLDVEELAGYSDLPGFLTRDENLGVDIITMADESPKGSGAGKHAKSVLDRLRSKYSVILVDAGSLTKSTGAYWLKCSDYRVIVIDSSVTTLEVLEHQRNTLKHLDIKLDGSILNKRVFPIPKYLYWLAR